MLILKELLQRHSAASALSAQGVHSGLGLVESGLASEAPKGSAAAPPPKPPKPAAEVPRPRVIKGRAERDREMLLGKWKVTPVRNGRLRLLFEDDGCFTLESEIW